MDRDVECFTEGNALRRRGQAAGSFAKKMSLLITGPTPSLPAFTSGDPLTRNPGNPSILRILTRNPDNPLILQILI